VPVSALLRGQATGTRATRDSNTPALTCPSLDRLARLFHIFLGGARRDPVLAPFGMEFSRRARLTAYLFICQHDEVETASIDGPFSVNAASWKLAPLFQIRSPEGTAPSPNKGFKKM